MDTQSSGCFLEIQDCCWCQSSGKQGAAASKRSHSSMYIMSLDKYGHTRSCESINSLAVLHKRINDINRRETDLSHTNKSFLQTLQLTAVAMINADEKSQAINSLQDIYIYRHVQKKAHSHKKEKTRTIIFVFNIQTNICCRYM